MQLISIGQFHKVIEKYLYWLSLPSIGFTDILEIIIISVIVYQMLKWVQLTRAWTLFKGIKRTGRTVKNGKICWNRRLSRRGKCKPDC